MRQEVDSEELSDEELDRCIKALENRIYRMEDEKNLMEAYRDHIYLFDLCDKIVRIFPEVQ